MCKAKNTSHELLTLNSNYLNNINAKYKLQIYSKACVNTDKYLSKQNYEQVNSKHYSPLNLVQRPVNQAFSPRTSLIFATIPTETPLPNPTSPLLPR